MKSTRQGFKVKRIRTPPSDWHGEPTAWTNVGVCLEGRAHTKDGGNKKDAHTKDDDMMMVMMVCSGPHLDVDIVVVRLDLHHAFHDGVQLSAHELRLLAEQLDFRLQGQ